MTIEPFVSDSDFTLYVGDVRDVLAGIPDGSVDCVVTSPPYWGLRDYGSEGQIGLEPTPEAYVEQMVAVFRQVRRVLADHGTCWVNLGDSYAHSLRQSGKAHAGNKQNTNAGSMREGFKDLPAGMKEKDLVGIPWRVAFALQADGWYLRSDIIWSKPNPMPESVTDRPTKAHEYVFLLSKQPRYFFDQEAVREVGTEPPHVRPASRMGKKALDGLRNASPNMDRVLNGTRNVRSVWEIATQPYPDAHFATFPEALAERCIKAGCPEWVCGTCGKARERLTSVSYDATTRTPAPNKGHLGAFGERAANMTRDGFVPNREKKVTTDGWSDCGHDNYRPGRVLDPFMGSGTVALVARNQRRHSIGIELNEEYARLCAKRLQQLSLLAEGTM